MKTILTERDDGSDFFVLDFGYEDVSGNAHWDREISNIHIIHYVLFGEGFFNSTRVKSGEGFYISAKSGCEYHSSSNKPWRYFWIAFAGDAADNIAEKYVNTNGSGIFEFNLNPEFLALVDNVLSESGAVSSGRALGYFYFLTSYHGKHAKPFHNHYVEEAKHYMSLNYSRSLSITEIASAVDVNDRYLYNLFIKYEGMSPKKYLSNLKLSRAELMLKNTRLSISEIAEHCGFSDVLAFSRFFSKNKSISPSKFRVEGL